MRGQMGDSGMAGGAQPDLLAFQEHPPRLARQVAGVPWPQSNDGDAHFLLPLNRECARH